ncbi:MAG: transglycosylase domain-containing protein [Lentisphaeria bacterium]|nr:transglycosylase domain-containing protein [Lentisphaeria bacterium]
MKSYLSSHRILAGVILVLAGVLLAGVIAWSICVRFISLPRQCIEERNPSSCFYDASGELIHVARGYDYRWNFPLEFSDIPEDMIRYVIAVEDRNFYSHEGFDFFATLRAAKQLVANGRIVSGASTITMQTMTMFTGRRRTLWYKIRQTILACNWERSHTKAETLELYFNNLPYGGKIYGLETAAQFYFGRHARELNHAEMILLAGIPQSPARFRPDRHPVQAVQRRDVVLHLLVKNGAITSEEADAIRREPLRYRDFSVPCWPHLIDTQYLDLALKDTPRRREYRLALDSNLQKSTHVALKNGIRNLEHVKDGAAVVIENATGRVRALIGTMDFMQADDGKVNAAIAWRSPGSTLKPFIYGEAIYGGLIVKDSILDDEMLLLNDYRPDNFDGSFRGRVSATEALADSLNTPAVRVLKMLGVNRVLDLLRQMDLLKKDGTVVDERIGLSLAIGGTESRLLNLACAYSRLANGCGRALFFEDDANGEEGGTEQLWSPGTREMVLDMMRFRVIPGGGGIDVAWKTGTSNGNRDAWCFAVSPTWTVGVWYGNKSGEAAEELVGGMAAAPVAAAIISLLHKKHPPAWLASGEITKAELCKKSGLRPSEYCSQTMSGSAVVGIPLRRCDECSAEKNLVPPKQSSAILRPMPGEYLANVRDENGECALSIQVDIKPRKAHLYVDGSYIGMHESGEKLTLKRGHHVITIWPNEDWTTAQIALDVREPL